MSTAQTSSVSFSNSATALRTYASQYKDELLNNVLPFWLQHSKDEENGGYFTCLNRDGSVYE